MPSVPVGSPEITLTVSLNFKKNYFPNLFSFLGGFDGNHHGVYEPEIKRGRNDQPALHKRIPLDQLAEMEQSRDQRGDGWGGRGRNDYY